MTPEQHERYGALVQANNALMVSGTAAGLPATAVAQVIAEAVTARRPRTRYAAGRDAAVITRLARVLPDRTLDLILRVNLGRHHARTTTA